MTNKPKILTGIFVNSLLCVGINTPALAASISPFSWNLTANLTLNPGLDLDYVDDMLENKLFLDLSYLDKYGGGIGVIHQMQSFVGSDISNDLFHANAWMAFYPQFIDGKLTTSLSMYQGSDLERVSSIEIVDAGSGNGPGPGPGPGNNSSYYLVNKQRYDVLILNPSVSFMNQDKTFFASLSFSQSQYETSGFPEYDVDVQQWSPAIGFTLVNPFNWIQLRYFHNQLSGESYTSDSDSSSDGASIGWTHWFQEQSPLGLGSMNATVLIGKRYFAVEQDVRKVFNVYDQQTGSFIFGATWKISDRFTFYTYAGYERFKEVSSQSKYDNVFLDFTLNLNW